MRTRLSLLACAAMLGAAVAFPLGVIASHQFTDVPISNSYHADIDAIRDAGVTTGCAPNLYCPKDFVTREQMAAFLNRLGALGSGKTPVVNADRVDGLSAGQFLRSDVAYAGRETCVGAAMVSRSSNDEFQRLGARQRVFNGPAGVICDPRLPHGATITGFSGRLSDFGNTVNLECHLNRYEKTEMLVETSLGSFASTLAFDAGVFFRRDTTIASPVVDNVTYAYLVGCTFSGDSTSLQVLHLDVEYTVMGHGQP